nr:hypothetical protein [Tanacetum cinerariifolium]GEZ41078.1 hypothetical protein [Tanacetum cinerariifolium]
MANVIPVDHVDDLLVVEPNQPDDVPIIPEPVLVDEDEDPEEEEFEEEKEPQEEDDMEVDIEEDKNEPALTYPYKEVDPLNPLPPTSDSEPEDMIEVEDTVKLDDKTVPASVYEVGKSKGEYYGKLILDLGNEVRSSVEEGTVAMENLTATLTQAAIRRMIKESVDAAIAAERARQVNARNDARGSGPVRGQDVAPVVRNDARGSGLVRGQDAAPVVRECTFAGFMKCNPTVFHEGKKVKFVATILQGPALTWWNSKVATMGLETVNQMP